MAAFVNPGWAVAARNAYGDCQTATLTKRKSALGERLRCSRVKRYPSWVARNASPPHSGTSNALIKTTGSAFMVGSLLAVCLTEIGVEPGGQLAEHACGRVEIGTGQASRELVDPGRCLRSTAW